MLREGRGAATNAYELRNEIGCKWRFSANQPAAWSEIAIERCKRSGRGEGGSAHHGSSRPSAGVIAVVDVESKRGGSCGEICAEQVPCVAGPCKPRGHRQIHAVKVQPPAALGDPYTPHFHPAAINHTCADVNTPVRGSW